MKLKFKKRYILGEGHPWALGVRNYKAIALSKEATGFNPKIINFPKELWEGDVPKYRLVLEIVNEKND
jgi:hypothetical protein